MIILKNNKLKNMKKHPIRNSLWQILLIIILLTGLLLVIEPFDENSIVFNTDFINVLYIVGFVGSVLVLVKNFAGRNYMKIYIPAAIVFIIISGLSIASNRLERLEQLQNSICGWDGDLYYCGNEEPITCDDGNYAVRDEDSYKCIGSDEYRHDVLGEEYDYSCIGKYEDKGTQLDAVTDLTLEEKACYEPKIEAAMKELIDAKKQGIKVSKFDIRDKVKVIAGNQGRSDTCEIWSSTKALEISAKLKGLDYQFLIDFEKKINGLDANIDGIIEDNTILLGSDHLIPGKKKYYYLSNDSSSGEDYENIPIYSYRLMNLIDKYSRILSRVYADKGEFYLYDEIPKAAGYERELLNLYTKELVMKYGSAFIHTTDSIQPGHRMLIIGWDDSREAWLVLNSWGNTWAHDKYVPDSNGDGTVWIKYSDKNFVVGSANISGNAIELVSE